MASRVISVRMPVELIERIDAVQGLSRSDLIRTAVEMYLLVTPPPPAVAPPS